MSSRLNIVDTGGNIIGEASREEIHKQGLLHREVHVWFYTPNGEIIFQHRAKGKETYPNLLDATSGGHVEIGDDFETTAVKEVVEETGVQVNKSDLHFICDQHTNSYDKVTKKRNNALRRVFAYLFTGKIDELKVEDSAGAGFEAWPIKKLSSLSDTEKERFIPTMYSKTELDIFSKVQTQFSK